MGLGISLQQLQLPLLLYLPSHKSMLINFVSLGMFQRCQSSFLHMPQSPIWQHTLTAVNTSRSLLEFPFMRQLLLSLWVGPFCKIFTLPHLLRPRSFPKLLSQRRHIRILSQHLAVNDHPFSCRLPHTKKSHHTSRSFIHSSTHNHINLYHLHFRPL
jgi:hypothetical protein